MISQAVNVATSQEVCLKRMIVGADPRTEKVARAEMAIFEQLKGVAIQVLLSMKRRALS